VEETTGDGRGKTGKQTIQFKQRHHRRRLARP
jgi:hypothetical protein